MRSRPASPERNTAAPATNEEPPRSRAVESASAPATPAPEPRRPRAEPPAEAGEGRSLFKRLSGALQKALGTPEKENEE